MANYQLIFSLAATSLHEISSWHGIFVKPPKKLIRSIESDSSASWEERLSKLPPLLSDIKAAKRSIDIVVPDLWVRSFVTTPASNATSFQDIQSISRLRFETLFDEPANAWQIEADWQIDNPFLCCAIPVAMKAALLKSFNAFTVNSILPHWLNTFNQHSDRMALNNWLVVRDQHFVSVIIFKNKRVENVVQSYSVGEKVDALDLFIRQEAVRLNQVVPHQVYCAGEFAFHAPQKLQQTEYVRL